MGKKYEELCSVLVLVLFIFWFCDALAVKNEVPFYRDLPNYFYPLRFSLYESLRAGVLPLWDRHFAQGFPNLAAFQTGAFYPPHYVLLFLTFYASIRALFIFHFLIAAIGAYSLLRRWNYSRDLCVVGSLLYTLGGVMVSLSNLLNHFQTAVWLPWLILTWERVLLTPRWNCFLTLILVSALQFLAGSPELFAMSMGLALLDGFRIRNSEPQVSCRRILGFALGANLVMLAMIMAQFLPTIELVMESRRGQSIPAVEALMWSLNPSSLLNLFFLDKEVEPNVASGITLFFARQVPFLVSSYIGAISPMGIALWLYYGTRREKIFLSAIALGSLAMALGGNALVYPFLFRHFPFVSAIRFPEKFLFVTYALVLYVTLLGLKGLLLDQTKKLKVPGMILGSIFLVWLGFYATLRFHSEIVADFIATHSNIPPMSEIHAKATVAVLANLQRQVILSGALFFLMILAKANKIRPLLFSVLLVSVVYVDLAWAHKGFLFPVLPDRINKSAPIAEPGETYLTRFFYYPSHSDLHPASFSVIGQPTFEQAAALSFQNYLPNAGVLRGVDYFQEIDALNRRSYSDFLSFANNLEFDRQIRLLRAFNVKHIVSFRELPEKGIRLVKHFPEYFSWLYRVEGTVARTYIVNNAIAEKEPLKALQRLSDSDFDPRREVIVDSEISIRRSQFLLGQTTIHRYENDIVTLQVSVNDEAVLVLADSYYPGWKAFLDGKETRILRANYFYRGVVVPRGNHLIEFRYEPLFFKIGLIVSVFTLFGLMVVSLCAIVRYRKRAAKDYVSTTEIVLN